MILRAILYQDRNQLRADKVSGSIWFSDAQRDRVCSMWFWCPSGSGQLCRITVGIEHKSHINSPTWNWNGNEENPTLSPSVNNLPSEVTPGWHGWLRDGYWETC